jgi:hypothetical protein
MGVRRSTIALERMLTLEKTETFTAYNKTSRYIIKEDNKFKQVFDMYIMLLVIYVAIVVPYRLAFSLEESKATKTISYVIDFSFLIDIILTFFTAYFDEPNFTEVDNYKDIAISYLKGWFIFDVLSIFPFELCI